MILFVAAAVAAATPQGGTCPNIVTPDALVCRALNAQTAGKNLTLNGGGTGDNVAGGLVTRGLGALRVVSGNPILTGTINSATA